MISFDEVIISPLDIHDNLHVSSFAIDWTLEPTHEDVSKYTFSISRAESPEGPFDQIADGIVDTYRYIDSGVNRYAKYRKFWYVVTATLEGESVTSEAATLQYPPDYFALEIIRRERLLLRRFIGIRCAITARRTLGAHCPDCWDEVKHRSRDPECETCLGSGYKGGWFPPIYIWVAMGLPDQIRVPQVWGELEQPQLMGWFTNYPIAKVGDVIVTRKNTRFVIENIHVSTRRGHPLRQIVQLAEVDKKDIRYKIPVGEITEPSDVFVGFYPPEGSGLL